MCSNRINETRRVRTGSLPTTRESPTGGRFLEKREKDASLKGRASFAPLANTNRTIYGAGGFLEVRHDELLPAIFSDPSPGMHKHLTVQYEIVGTGGNLTSYEMDGRLLEPIHASALPVVAPQVLLSRGRRRRPRGAGGGSPRRANNAREQREPRTHQKASTKETLGAGKKDGRVQKATRERARSAAVLYLSPASHNNMTAATARCSLRVRRRDRSL